jgi:hypothetical protein
MPKDPECRLAHSRTAQSYLIPLNPVFLAEAGREQYRDFCVNQPVWECGSGTVTGIP